MIIQCTSCSTGYLLPDHLLGPGGARVRCPKCQVTFEVSLHTSEAPATAPAALATAMPAEAGALQPAATSTAPAASANDAPAREAQGSLTAPAAADHPATATLAAASTEVAAPAADDESMRVAHELLDALAEQLGERIQSARARGKVLAEFGPDLMRAYDAYRRRLGAGASPVGFRTVLRERWGVDLIAGVEP